MTSNLIHSFIHILRESKLEIKERFKMQRHYGMFRDPIVKLKTVRLGFPTNTNTWFRAQDEGKCQDYAIPNELDALLNKIRDSYRINKRIFDNPPMMTFVSYQIPRRDKTSSEYRLFHILKILLKNSCKIDFLYCQRTRNDLRYTKMFQGNINFIHLPLDLKKYVQSVNVKNSQYIWITELWRLNYVRFMAELVNELKDYSTNSKLIVDAIDFHFKEFYRKYDQTKDPNDLNLANNYLKSELILYRAADVVVVVSEDEKKDIRHKIPGIAHIEVIPNVHEISTDLRAYAERKNICFIGNFGTKHNFDAVQYFLDSIFHLIHKMNPTVEFHVIGNLSEKYRKEFRRPNVKVIGSLKYLHKALTHYKLFVCPLTYGTGMKGKIGEAVAAGIPIVTTSLGAEGFPVTDGTECFIADSPYEFAEKCNQCLNDPVLWHNFSYKSRLIMAENFSPGVVAGKLKKVLSK